MRKSAVAFATACCVYARIAGADLVTAGNILQFGIPARMSATEAIDVPHFVYIPGVGPWLDMAHGGSVRGSMVFDGLCQVTVALTFAMHMFRHHAAATLWHVLPWFPQSGGGGLSLMASF
jgi:hypothetical protein